MRSRRKLFPFFFSSFTFRLNTRIVASRCSFVSRGTIRKGKEKKKQTISLSHRVHRIPPRTWMRRNSRCDLRERRERERECWSDRENIVLKFVAILSRAEGEQFSRRLPRVYEPRCVAARLCCLFSARLDCVRLSFCYVSAIFFCCMHGTVRRAGSSGVRIKTFPSRLSSSPKRRTHATPIDRASFSNYQDRAGTYRWNASKFLTNVTLMNNDVTFINFDS